MFHANLHIRANPAHVFVASPRFLRFAKPKRDMIDFDRSRMTLRDDPVEFKNRRGRWLHRVTTRESFEVGNTSPCVISRANSGATDPIFWVRSRAAVQ